MNYQAIHELKIKILSDHSDRSLNDKIVSVVNEIPNLSTNEALEHIKMLQNEIVGYGVIQQYLDDESISELMINGLESFYIERGGEIHCEKVLFENEEHIMQLVYRIASEVGREVNQSKPILDARLKDGSRVNIVLNPVAINGPVITIRKFHKNILSTEVFVNSGTMPMALAVFLQNLVKAKYNIFISGGTGTGKTTLLNYISQSIPKGERIVTIEDAAEIDIKSQGHVISMETKSATSSTKQDVSINMSRLIKNALRMRPDRIIVGEVRGEEVVDMLQAMNTGHDGSISTGHANSPLDMLIRLEVIAASYSDINHLLIRKQIISAIDIVIHLERIDGKRRIAYVEEITKNTEDFKTNQIYDSETDFETTLEEFENRLREVKKYHKHLKR